MMKKCVKRVTTTKNKHVWSTLWEKGGFYVVILEFVAYGRRSL